MTRGDQGLHRYIVISRPTSCKSTPPEFRVPTRYCFSVDSQKEGRRKFRRGQSAWPENQKSCSDQKRRRKKILPKLRLLSNEWYCTSVLSELGDVLNKKKEEKKTVGRSVRPLETCDLWFLPSSLCAIKMPWPGQKHVSWQKQAISLPVGIIRQPKAYRDVQQSTIFTSRHISLVFEEFESKGHLKKKNKKRKKSELVIFFSSRHTPLFVLSP